MKKKMRFDYCFDVLLPESNETIKYLVPNDLRNMIYNEFIAKNFKNGRDLNNTFAGSYINVPVKNYYDNYKITPPIRIGVVKKAHVIKTNYKSRKNYPRTRSQFLLPTMFNKRIYGEIASFMEHDYNKLQKSMISYDIFYWNNILLNKKRSVIESFISKTNEKILNINFKLTHLWYLLLNKKKNN